ncbi:hypothetical protein GE21DRAFT_1278361 [Neurospora crassa]|nr:hypothetical protein GE21DRAFT_1278361 [Neurospora crassa]
MAQVALLRLCYLPMVEGFPRIRMFGPWFSAASLPSSTRDLPCRPYRHIPPIGWQGTKQVQYLTAQLSTSICCPAIHNSIGTGQLDIDPGSLSALSSDPLAPLVALPSSLSGLLLISPGQSLVCCEAPFLSFSTLSCPTYIQTPHLLTISHLQGNNTS